MILVKRAGFVSSLEFKKLELSDRAVMEGFLSRFPSRISGFTFAALFCWSGVYSYEWTPCGEESLLISCRFLLEEGRHFLQPVGNFNAEEQALLLEDIRQKNYPVKIFGVSGEFIRKHLEFAAHFEVQDDPALANYIYRVSDLSGLAGKFYAKKRNMIAQARNLYSWTVHPLTQENSGECLEVLMRMEEGDPGETSAVRAALQNFSRLGQRGLLIKVDGKGVAFSVFEEIFPGTAGVHFEKADRHYKGLYQVINQESAKALEAAGFSLINREEDIGVPGLRQAKHSYGPVEVVPSHTLVFRR